MVGFSCSMVSKWFWGCLVIFYSQPELSSPQEKMVLHLIAESRFLIETDIGFNLLLSKATDRNPFS